MFPVFPKGVSIALVKSKGQIYAISNKCAHMGCPLTVGTLDGYVLTCPCHDWRYDIRTGQFLDAKEIIIPTYEWKIEDGKVFIKLGDVK